MLKMRAKKTCFVIMPFGEKEDTGGKVVDFDDIYRFMIKNTVENIGISCVRCDEIAESGWIQSKMFEHIYESDVAIVDITLLNPNVFYELGIRHALVEAVTVLIRRKGTALPFNVHGLQVIDYDPEDIASVEEAKKKIVDFIQNGLKLKKKDSPVHEVLDLKVGSQPKRLTKTEVFTYQFRDVPKKKISLITGAIHNIKIVDIWVNSENTNMQMARPYNHSVSSVIRYVGAKKDRKGRVVEDTIARELAKIMGDDMHVDPATVIVTGAGELGRTHNVKKIFHAAAVIGQVGEGYTPIADIGMCVQNALQKAESEELRNTELRSILFPLMGTGTGRGKLPIKAKELIDAAISYVEANPSCVIEQIYFLTLSDKELRICQRILQEAIEVVVVKSAKRSRE